MTLITLMDPIYTLVYSQCVFFVLIFLPFNYGFCILFKKNSF